MTNQVQAWMSNVRGAEYGFLKAVVYALEQFEEKNNIPLTAMVAICNGKPFSTYRIVDGDRLQFAAPLKRVLDKALSGCKLTFKDGKAKWKVSANGGVNRDILEGLRVLSASGASIRSQAFKDAFPVVKSKKVKPHDEAVEAMAKRILKSLENENEARETEDSLTLGEIIEALRVAVTA